MDEAGRGALAGPVFAAAVILPADESLLWELAGVRDSKQLRAHTRSFLEPIIKRTASAWGVGSAEVAEIDQWGIAKAARLAFVRALQALQINPDYLLLDYFALPEVQTEQTCLVKGDQRSLSIACASILAKVARDDLMQTQAAAYPGYGWEHNRGYGTSGHRQAIRRLGACALHRHSFNLL